MPVGRALHAEPVDFSVLVDVGQPRHFRILNVTVVDERMKPRLPEAAPERCELGGPQILLREHEDGMSGEGTLDPGQRFRIQRPCEIDPSCLGGQRPMDRAKARRPGQHVHLPQRGDSSTWPQASCTRAITDGRSRP